MSSWEAYDESKTAELVMLVAEHTEDDPTAGSTTLNKILYFAEISHLRRTGKPITGSEYQKQPHGPTLRRMPPLIRHLEDEGAAKDVEEDYFGYAQKKLVALREPDLTGFSAVGIESVMDMVRQFWGRAPKRHPTFLTKTRAGEQSSTSSKLEIPVVASAARRRPRAPGSEIDSYASGSSTVMPLGRRSSRIAIRTGRRREYRLRRLTIT